MQSLESIDRLIKHLTLQIDSYNKKLENYNYFTRYKKANKENIEKCMEYRNKIYYKSKELKFLKSLREAIIDEEVQQINRSKTK